MWEDLTRVDNRPYWIRDEDDCYFMREFAAKKDWKYSDDNGLIWNLKKDPSTEGTNQWWHKLRAIDQFAEDVEAFFEEQGLTNGVPFYVAAIPPSKKRGHEAFDPRFDLLFEKLNSVWEVRVVEPIIRRKSMKAAHQSDDRPKIHEIYESLKWNGGLGEDPDEEIDRLILIDDVITAGCHYRACKKFFNENASDIQVTGLFWARTVRPDQDEIDHIEYLWED